MKRYKSTATLHPITAAYIAGLVDGEGTITLTRMHPNETRRLVISISNNERPMLEYVLLAVVAGKITTKRTYSDRHAPAFAYQITSRQALDLLRQIAPYLRSYKSLRAALALREYLRVTPRNGRYDESTKKQRGDFELNFLAITSRTPG